MYPCVERGISNLRHISLHRPKLELNVFFMQIDLKFNKKNF